MTPASQAINRRSIPRQKKSRIEQHGTSKQETHWAGRSGKGRWVGRTLRERGHRGEHGAFQQGQDAAFSRSRSRRKVGSSRTASRFRTASKERLIEPYGQRFVSDRLFASS